MPWNTSMFMQNSGKRHHSHAGNCKQRLKRADMQRLLQGKQMWQATCITVSMSRSNRSKRKQQRSKKQHNMLWKILWRWSRIQMNISWGPLSHEYVSEFCQCLLQMLLTTMEHMGSNTALCLSWPSFHSKHCSSSSTRIMHRETRRAKLRAMLIPVCLKGKFGHLAVKNNERTFASCEYFSRNTDLKWEDTKRLVYHKQKWQKWW